MFIFISDKTLQRLENIMSQFLEDARAILERVTQGRPEDPQMKADVAELKAAVLANTEADAANAASDADVKTLLTEILNKLASSTPSTTPPVV